MSTTAHNRAEIPVRIPDWIANHDHRQPDERAAAGADARIRELDGYRLARLEAEVLAPTRGVTPTDLRLRRVISAYARLAITDPGIMTLLSSQRRGPDRVPLPRAVRMALDRFVGALHDDLGELIRAQDRDPSIDSDVAVQSLLGFIHWGVGSHHAESRLSREEAVAQITFLALHGLVGQTRTSTLPAENYSRCPAG